MTSVLNRVTIQKHGLDWTHMGAAPGIAGSTQPEQKCIFLAATPWERDYFADMNNTGGPVDVWEVSGVAHNDLRTSPQGYLFFPAVISTSQISPGQKDIEPRARGSR